MTSKTLKAFIATAATALLVAGCATGTESEAPETSTSTTSVTTSSTTTTPPTTSETPDPPPEPEPAPEPAVAPAPAYTAPVAAPTFSYCYLADGTAMMSDGTTTYMDSCNESAGGPYLLEDGSPAITYSPEDLADANSWSNCIEAGGTSETCSG